MKFVTVAGLAVAAALLISCEVSCEKIEHDAAAQLEKKIGKLSHSDQDRVRLLVKSGQTRDASALADSLAKLQANGAAHFDPFLLDEESQAVLQRLNPSDSAGFQLIQTLGVKSSKVRLVWGDVRRFSEAIQAGWRNPALLRLADPELVSKFESVARDHRIAVIGAGKDITRINAMRAKARAHGYEVYFYDDCHTPAGDLCPAGTVGAFFANAGHIWLLQTAQSDASRYVSVESETVRRLIDGEAMLIFVTPEQIMQAAGRTKVMAVTIQLNSLWSNSPNS